MLVSDMQCAVGEKLFNLPQFAQWAKKIADRDDFRHVEKPAKKRRRRNKKFHRINRYNSRQDFPGFTGLNPK